MIAFFLIGCALYFVPTICASSRDVAKSTGIIVLNIFLGWTVVGWVIALVWAVSGETKQQVRMKEFAFERMATLTRDGGVK